MNTGTRIVKWLYRHVQNCVLILIIEYRNTLTTRRYPPAQGGDQCQNSFYFSGWEGEKY
jgi:hypothetical protein